MRANRFGASRTNDTHTQPLISLDLSPSLARGQVIRYVMSVGRTEWDSTLIRIYRVGRQIFHCTHTNRDETCKWRQGFVSVCVYSILEGVICSK